MIRHPELVLDALKVDSEEKLFDFLEMLFREEYYSRKTWVADIINVLSRQFYWINDYWDHLNRMRYDEVRLLSRKFNSERGV